MRIAKLSLLVLSLLVGGFLSAQITCNPAGNLWVYANYDGGVLNIDVDVNIPNIKIGVCTYEPVTINFTGPFAGNVTEVRYAGYVSTTNFHCSNSPSTTTITGVPANITSVNFLPPSTLSNPNGYSSIVCAYSCGTTSNQGGCNTADQIKDYFQTTMGGTLVSYYTQYGCWATLPYTLSSGGNCCSSVVQCTLVANAGSDDAICPGGSTMLNGTSQGGGTTYSWSPASGLSDPNIANPMASPTQTTTYVLTVTDGAVCADVDSVVITVLTPQVAATVAMAGCAGGSPFALTGGQPAGGTWSGNHVSNGMFDPNAAGAGNHSVTYIAVDSNGCPGQATATVIVNPLPTVTMQPVSPFCLNSPAYLLANGSPTGGAYAGPGIANGSFFPAVAGVGNHSVQYAFTDSNGCSDTATSIFSVYANPAAASVTLSGIDSLQANTVGDSFVWYFNGLPWLTNGPSVQATQSGNYTVIVWENGCPSELSEPLAVNLVGVAEGNVSLRYWPNPAGASLYLEVDGGLIQVSVFDMTGRQVVDTKSISGFGEIRLTGLEAGQYLVKVEGDQGISTFKILKQ